MMFSDGALILAALALLVYLLWLWYLSDPGLGRWLRRAGLVALVVVALHHELWSWSWLLVIVVVACVAAAILCFAAWALDEIPRWRQ